MTGKRLIRPDHELTIGEDGIVLRRETAGVLRGLMLTFAGAIAVTALLFATALWPRNGQWPHPEGVDFSVGLVVVLRQALKMYSPLLPSLAALAGGAGLAGLIVGVAISPDIEWRVDKTTITRISRFRRRTAEDSWPFSTVVGIRPYTIWTRRGPQHSVTLRLIDNRILLLPVDTEDEADVLARALQRLAGIDTR
jgi:hypothetical protein